jgi:hypothetical protein
MTSQIPQIECPSCQGYGMVRIAIDDAMECPACAGTGWRQATDGEIGYIVALGNRGRNCVAAIPFLHRTATALSLAMIPLLVVSLIVWVGR